MNAPSIFSPNNITMSSREIADLVEKQHSNIKISAERLAEKAVIGTLATQEFTHNGNTYTEYLFNKRDSLILVAQNCPEFTARIVDRWQELEAQVTLMHRTSGQLRDELEAVDVLARILNVSASGKITMAKASLEHHGAKHLIAALPVYAIDAPPKSDNSTPTSSSPTASITELLKSHGISVTAREMNRRLVVSGFLVELTRPSSKGGEKRFLSVTIKGELYGKNVTSPSNPRETQPHWYRETFASLCRQVGISIDQMI